MMRQLSLFTGSGIGDLAAERCGITTVAQCENNPIMWSALKRLWPNAHHFKDVCDVTAEALSRHGLLPIDIISGGFPCQDISTAGKGAGLDGQASGLWFQMLRVIREVRPNWVLAENVPALRSRGADRVLDGLEAEGYTCRPVVVGAEHCGAPHRRHRVWIVAHRAWEQREQRAEWDGVGICGGPILAHNAVREWSDAPAPIATSNQEVHEKCESNQSTENRNDGITCERCDGRGWVLKRISDDWPTTCGRCGGTGKELANLSERGQRTDGGARQQDRHADECDKTMGDSASDTGQRGSDEQERGPEGRIAVRWPSRPGQPQYDWEHPRITKRPLDIPTDGLARRLLAEAFGCSSDCGDETFNRVAQRLEEIAAARRNKSGLHAAGNAWTFPNAVLMYRWIANQEGR